jgi:ribosomal protein L40E
MSETLKTAQNGCRKCGAEMLPSKAIVCRATGMSDFIGSKDVVTMSPDPREPVLVDCEKCRSCGWSVTPGTPMRPMTNNERFALV